MTDLINVVPRPACRQVPREKPKDESHVQKFLNDSNGEEMIEFLSILELELQKNCG